MGPDPTKHLSTTQELDQATCYSGMSASVTKHLHVETCFCQSIQTLLKSSGVITRVAGAIFALQLFPMLSFLGGHVTGILAGSHRRRARLTRGVRRRSADQNSTKYRRREWSQRRDCPAGRTLICCARRRSATCITGMSCRWLAFTM